MTSERGSQRTVDLNVGLETVGHAECLRLLAGQDVGRLGVVVAGKPEIFPVNYVTDGDGVVVFRTGAGTKLAGALAGPIVFEVDHLDGDLGAGWSVVVHGSARRISPAHGAVFRGRLAGCSVQPAPGNDRVHLFGVVPITVSGRQIRPPRDPDHNATGRSPQTRTTAAQSSPESGRKSLGDGDHRPWAADCPTSTLEP